ncbi:MAG: DUF5667 domain-containing protein [Chloroflexi bacterium]|nr:DUF5667 domain-containing protein [Chloroflexota bacterium]
MKQPVDEILQECLTSLEKGDLTPDQCLEKYPDYRDELAILIKLAGDLKALPQDQPRPEFVTSSPARLQQRIDVRRLQAINQKRIGIIKMTKGVNIFRRPAFAFIIASLLFVLLVGVGTVNAASVALPGDALYPVKIGLENAQISLAGRDQAIALRIQFANTRAQEINGLIEEQRYSEIPVAAASLENTVQGAVQGLNEIKNNQPAEASTLAEKLDTTLSNNNTALNRVLTKVPEKAKKAIEHAILVSNQEHNRVENAFPPASRPTATPEPTEIGTEATPTNQIGTPTNLNPAGKPNNGHNNKPTEEPKNEHHTVMPPGKPTPEPHGKPTP